jgi:hypothetical protein
MKKYSEEIEKVVKETIEYTVANCIKCNSDDIDLFSQEKYSSDGSVFIFGGRCVKCGSEHTKNKSKKNLYIRGIQVVNGSNLVTKSESADVWNMYNDIDLIISRHQSSIEEHKIEIIGLTELKKERNQ